jgi:hypothetical protein
MSNKEHLGRLVTRLAGAIHPRPPGGPLDERSTRTLFLALTRSFESRFNELYPGPQSNLQPSSSPFSLANRHFESITNHPLFTMGPQADRHKRLLGEQVKKVFVHDAEGQFNALMTWLRNEGEVEVAYPKTVKITTAIKTMLSSNEPVTQRMVKDVVYHLQHKYPDMLAQVLSDKHLSGQMFTHFLTSASPPQPGPSSPDIEFIWSVFTTPTSSQTLSKLLPSLFTRFLQSSLQQQSAWFALQQIERAQALSSSTWFNTQRAKSALLQLSTYILRNPASSLTLWVCPISRGSAASPNEGPLKLDSYLGKESGPLFEATSFLNAAIWLSHPSRPSPALAVGEIHSLQASPELLQRARTKKNIQFPYVHLCLKTVELLIKQEKYAEAENVLMFAGREFPIFGQQEPASSAETVAESETTSLARALAPQTSAPGEYKLAVIRLCLTFVEQLISKSHYPEAQRIMLFAREKFPDVLDKMTTTSGTLETTSRGGGKGGKRKSSDEKGAIAILDGILPH